MTEDRFVCDFCGSTRRHADDCQPPEHGSDSCDCLDCHAVRHETPGSCSCSLCQDRYRLRLLSTRELSTHAPTPRKAGDSSVTRSAVASVAAESDGGR